MAQIQTSFTMFYSMGVLSYIIYLVICYLIIKIFFLCPESRIAYYERNGNMRNCSCYYPDRLSMICKSEIAGGVQFQFHVY